MAILDKIKDVVNPGSKHNEERGRESVARSSAATDGESRSQSRGRGLVVGTGRGGAGNMSHSQVRPDDADESAAAIEAARSRSRSRARAAHHGHDAPQASGRGGAGNVHRSPSGARDPLRAAESRERGQKMAMEDEATRKKYEQMHSADSEYVAGRGGFGNISHSHHAQATNGHA